MAMANLPEEIFDQHPLTTACKIHRQVQVLSKTMASSSSTPQFIKSHLENLILISPSHSIYTIAAVKDDAVSRKLDMPKTWTKVVGSCDGLVLLESHYCEMLLVNPITLQQVKIPDSRPALMRNKRSHGFGYDSISDDYKVVSLSYDDTDNQPNCIDTILDVYYVKMGVWKRVVSSLHDHAIPIISSGAFVNGAIHWLFTSAKLGYPSGIAAFRLADEVFDEIPAPTGVSFGIYAVDSLIVLGGCLCMTDTLNNGFWIMKEYGVRESWTKFSINNADCSFQLIKPLCFLGDEEVMLLTRRLNLVVYNMKEVSWRKMVVDGVPANFIDGCTFVESLVSPTFSNHDIKFSFDMPPIHGIQGVANFLLTNSRIGNLGTHYNKYPRYVPLNCTQMFDQLVKLYSVMFKFQWQHFKTLFNAFVIPQGVEPATYAARVYISTWLFDLYSSIREATRAISSPLAFNEKYHEEVMPYSTQYDEFLVLLKESLKPTHIQYTPEDTLYIPLVCKNPVQITNFALNDEVFYRLLHIMKECNNWKIQNVSTNTKGRPFWLFDWHDEQTCCAWFPNQGNYDNTDLALAYIVGAACTPNLGPRDVDDWQFPLNGVNPTKKDIAKLNRISERSFFGSYETRTLETDDCYNLPDSIVILFKDSDNKKRKVPKGGQDKDTTSEMEIVVPSFNRYKLIDWCYHARVVVNSDWETRIDGLRMICMG